MIGATSRLARLPFKVESPCRKEPKVRDSELAPDQYAGANPYRRSHATPDLVRGKLSPGFAQDKKIAPAFWASAIVHQNCVWGRY
jgi:hypothetical protein